METRLLTAVLQPGRGKLQLSLRYQTKARGLMLVWLPVAKSHMHTCCGPLGCSAWLPGNHTL